MNAEYFNLLAGDLGDIQSKETELEIPAFLTPEWGRMERMIAEAQAAREAAAVGRHSRRKRKTAQKKHRQRVNNRIGILIVPVFASLLILAEKLLDLLLL